VYYAGEYVDCAVYDRASLRPGDRLPGPCVVEQYDTTTFLTPRFVATCDDFGNLIVEAQA
jgi:N-methylhydantoinase A